MGPTKKPRKEMPNERTDAIWTLDTQSLTPAKNAPQGDDSKTSVRTRKRDLYFGNCADRIWDRKRSGGYATIPKTALLIAELIGKLEKDALLPFTMLGLWFSTWDNGFVEVLSEERLALECGFVQKSPNRRTYEWRKRVEKLESLGFVEVRRSGDTTISHILLLDPHRAITALYLTNKRLADGIKSYDTWRYIFERLRDKSIEVGSRDMERLFESRSLAATKAKR